MGALRRPNGRISDSKRQPKLLRAKGRLRLMLLFNGDLPVACLDVEWAKPFGPMEILKESLICGRGHIFLKGDVSEVAVVDTGVRASNLFLCHDDSRGSQVVRAQHFPMTYASILYPRVLSLPFPKPVLSGNACSTCVLAT